LCLCGFCWRGSTIGAHQQFLDKHVETIQTLIDERNGVGIGFVSDERHQAKRAVRFEAACAIFGGADTCCCCIVLIMNSSIIVVGATIEELDKAARCGPIGSVIGSRVRNLAVELYQRIVRIGVRVVVRASHGDRNSACAGGLISSASAWCTSAVQPCRNQKGVRATADNQTTNQSTHADRQRKVPHMAQRDVKWIQLLSLVPSTNLCGVESNHSTFRSRVLNELPHAAYLLSGTWAQTPARKYNHALLHTTDH
jgi:hypothetical protein